MNELRCPDCEGKLADDRLTSPYFSGDCLVCATCSVICDPTGVPVTYPVKGTPEKIYKSDRGTLLETQLHLALVGYMIEMEQNAGVGAREGDDTVMRDRTEALRRQVLGEGDATTTSGQ